MRSTCTTYTRQRDRLCSFGTSFCCSQEPYSQNRRKSADSSQIHVNGSRKRHSFHENFLTSASPGQTNSLTREDKILSQLSIQDKKEKFQQIEQEAIRVSIPEYERLILFGDRPYMATPTKLLNWRARVGHSFPLFVFIVALTANRLSRLGWDAGEMNEGREGRNAPIPFPLTLPPPSLIPSRFPRVPLELRELLTTYCGPSAMYFYAESFTINFTLAKLKEND